MSCAHANICSNVCDTACSTSTLRGARSEPSDGTAGWNPSWIPTATPSSSAASQNGSYAVVDDRSPEARVRPHERGDEPELLAGASQLARRAAPGSWNGTIAAPCSRSGAAAQ